MKLIMATTNKDKVREIREMLKDSDIDIVSLAEAGITAEIEENGTTFEENATIKAETIRDLTGQMVIADDSGLVVDAMDGAPGVYSARFMGEDTGYDEKCGTILKNLEGLEEEKRGARFVCAMAIAYPKETGKKTSIFKGVFEGRIAYESKGENGFGYDPIFYVPEKQMTAAQLSDDEKNEVSHRGKALRKAVEELKKGNKKEVDMK